MSQASWWKDKETQRIRHSLQYWTRQVEAGRTTEKALSKLLYWSALYEAQKEKKPAARKVKPEEQLKTPRRRGRPTKKVIPQRSPDPAAVAALWAPPPMEGIEVSFAASFD